MKRTSKEFLEILFHPEQRLFREEVLSFIPGKS